MFSHGIRFESGSSHTLTQINNNMDEFKFKKLEDWLKDARKNDCDHFIGMAINKDHKLCGVANCSGEELVEMLMTSCHQNEPIKAAIIVTANILLKEEEAKEKGGKQ